jgi:hypothetical protein
VQLRVSEGLSLYEFPRRVCDGGFSVRRWISSGGFRPRRGWVRLLLADVVGRFSAARTFRSKRGSKIMKNLKIPPPVSFRQSAKNDQF